MQTFKGVIFSLLVASLIIIFCSNGESQVLWYPFEGSGKTAEDFSGNGKHGDIAAGSRIEGKYNKGFSFGKADEYIEIPNVLEPAGTIEFWFKPNWDGSDAETYRIFDASTAAIFFCIGKGAQVGERAEELTFCFENAADTDIFMSVIAEGIIKVGKWHHLAATWDFDSSEAAFYVNGEEVASAEDIGGFPPLDTNPRIGFNNQHAYKVADNGADSVIDEFAIYPRTMDSNDIKRDMAELAYAIEPYCKLPVLWGRIKWY